MCSGRRPSLSAPWACVSARTLARHEPSPVPPGGGVAAIRVSGLGRSPADTAGSDTAFSTMERKWDARGRSGPRIGVTGDTGSPGSHFVRHRGATHGGELLNADAQIADSFPHGEVVVTGHDTVGGCHV